MSIKIQCDFTSVQSAKKAGTFIKNTFEPVFKTNISQKEETSLESSGDVYLFPPVDFEAGLLDNPVIPTNMDLKPGVSQSIHNVQHLNSENLRSPQKNQDLLIDTTLEIWTEQSAANSVISYMHSAGGSNVKVVKL